MQEQQSLPAFLKILGSEKKTMRDKYGVLHLAIFGSYAKHEQNKESDVDLIVELEDGYKTFDNYMELKFFLEEKLQKKVDLALKDSLRKELKTGMLREAVYVS